MSLMTAIEDESQGGTSRFHDVRFIGALAGRYAFAGPAAGRRQQVTGLRLPALRHFQASADRRRSRCRQGR